MMLGKAGPKKKKHSSWNFSYCSDSILMYIASDRMDIELDEVGIQLDGQGIGSNSPDVKLDTPDIW